MRALSLWGPWDVAIAMGTRTGETRDWRPGFEVGEKLVIHGAQMCVKWEEISDLMMGVMVAVIRELNDELSTLQDYSYYYDLQWRKKKRPTGLLAVATVERIIDSTRITPLERMSIDLRTLQGRKRYAVLFDEIWAFDEPIPWKGRQGIFHVDDELVKNRAKHCTYKREIAAGTFR